MTNHARADLDEAVLITGATSGLGEKLARRLAKAGRTVVVGGRRTEAVFDLCRFIDKNTTGRAVPLLADLADLAALQNAIEGLPQGSLRGIVANAGTTTRKDERTAEGFELMFGVNVLAHQFLLCTLAPRVIDGGRIVILSSGTHDPDNKLARRFNVPVPRWIGTEALARPDSVSDERRLELGAIRYSTSKLANVLQARGLQLALREAGRDVDVFAVDPGLMVDTRLTREMPGRTRAFLKSVGYIITPFVDNMRLSKTTAAYIERLLLGDEWSGRGFAYLDGLDAREPSPDARRDDLRDELWSESLRLLGINDTQLVWRG